MDNQVHHPHVTYSSEVGGSYSKDYYNDKARNCDDCSEDLGCGCLGLFFMCVAMLSTALFFVKFVGTPNNSFTNFCLQSVSCNDAKKPNDVQQKKNERLIALSMYGSSPSGSIASSHA